jgi:RimJ/RimL family protein N-acetyltransferase
MPPLPLPDPELADDAIRLRPPTPAGVPAITAACQDPDTQHFTLVPVPCREQDAQAWARRAIEIGYWVAPSARGWARST